MRKTLVAVFVCIGLLAGCMNQNNHNAYNRETAERLGTFRYLCENEQGVQDQTPEMADCIMQMGRKTPRKITSPRVNQKYRTANNQMSGEAWIRMGSAMTCQSRGGIPNYNTGDCTLPQQPRGGRLYDSSGEYIGTYREN